MRALVGAPLLLVTFATAAQATGLLKPDDAGSFRPCNATVFRRTELATFLNDCAWLLNGDTRCALADATGSHD